MKRALMITFILTFLGVTLVAWTPAVSNVEGGLTFSWDAIFKGLWIIGSLVLSLVLLPIWKQQKSNTKAIDKISILTDREYLKTLIREAVHEEVSRIADRVAKIEGRLDK